MMRISSQLMVTYCRRVKLVTATKRRNYEMGGYSDGYSTFADSKFDCRDADEIFREFFGGKDPFEAFFGNNDPFEAFFANTGNFLFMGLFAALTVEDWCCPRSCSIALYVGWQEGRRPISSYSDCGKMWLKFLSVKIAKTMQRYNFVPFTCWLYVFRFLGYMFC